MRWTIRISKSRITHGTAGEIPLIFGFRLQFASDGCHQWKAEKWDGWLATEGAGEIFTQQGRVAATPGRNIPSVSG
jgi:hypothetical protein